MTRKKLFGVALVYSGSNKARFAARENVAPSTLQDVLDGKKTSARLTKAVDAYCRVWIKQLREELEFEERSRVLK